jgi:hypothetical protein
MVDVVTRREKELVMKEAIVALVLTFAVALSLAAHAQQAQAGGPRYTNGTSLLRPTDYREWPFIGSSLGLAYTPLPGGAPPPFTNVFVNPASYRSFMQTGKWPDTTILVLEVRRSINEGTLIQGGRYQGDLLVLEAHVKDSRFPDGWAFFSWGTSRTGFKDVAEPAPTNAAIPGEGTCVECHVKHAAVERTFVQFYPTLLEVARQKGTLKPDFDSK